MSIIRSTSLCLLALFSLSACSQPATKPTVVPAEDPTLAGVNLNQPIRLLGTEPFWSLDISASTLIYKDVENVQHRAENTGPEMVGTMAIWQTKTGTDAPMKVTLIATDCSDGMSDRIYPLTARVEMDQLDLKGCAAALTALEKAGEAGRVQ